MLRFKMISRQQVFQAAKTGVAAGVAWVVAMPVDPTHRPYFAPIAAVVVVQPTIYDSLSRAAQRVGGVVIGVAAALAIAHFVTLNAWTIGLVAFVGLLIGWFLRLGPQGVVQVPVSALLVLLIGSLRTNYGAARLYETLIGAAIGAGVALLSPTAPAPSGPMRLGVEAIQSGANLMSEIGVGLGSAWSRTEATAWEARASELVDATKEARGRLDAARLTARWNTRARGLGSALADVEDALQSAERITIQVRQITRALVDASDQARPLRSIGTLVSSTAGAACAFGIWRASDDDVTARRSLDGAVRAAERALRATIERVHERWGNDPSAWLTFGLVLAATEQILADARRPIDRLPGRSSS